MTAATTTVTRPLSPSSRRRRRLLGVAGAVAAALAVWAGAELLGVQVLAPGFGDHPAQDIGAGNVIFSAGVASLAGWGLLAALERLTRHARTLWTTTAAVVLLASLGAPLSGAGITGGNRAVLLLLHLVVAAVLIPALRRSAANPPA